jgi:hypothetical protein
MVAILKVVSAQKGEFLMTQEQFECEKNYRISLAVAKRMRLAGIISEQDYKKIDTILLEKYQPVLGCICRHNA